LVRAERSTINAGHRRHRVRPCQTGLVRARACAPTRVLGFGVLRVSAKILGAGARVLSQHILLLAPIISGYDRSD
jgi:hypothetical protein